MCVCVCFQNLRLCLSLASDSSETVEVIIIKLTQFKFKYFIQGHTDLNHEHNKCLIISETVQAMPIKFAVKIV